MFFLSKLSPTLNATYFLIISLLVCIPPIRSDKTVSVCYLFCHISKDFVFPSVNFQIYYGIQVSIQYQTFISMDNSELSVFKETHSKCYKNTKLLKWVSEITIITLKSLPLYNYENPDPQLNVTSSTYQGD